MLGTRGSAVNRAVLPQALAEVVGNSRSGRTELHILFLRRKLNSMCPGAKVVYGVKYISCLLGIIKPNSGLNPAP